jgi:hypothetical protein
MTRYYRLWPVLLLLIATACSKNLSFTFEFPQEKLQKKLSEKFPIKPGSEDKEKSPLALTVSDPTVLLEEGKDQIGLHVNIVAEAAAPTSVAPKGDAPKLPPGAAKPPLPGPPGPPAPPANAPRPRFTGTATLYGSISYDPAAKAIRIVNPKITSLEIAQLPAQLSEPISRYAEKMMAEKFAEKPIPLENKNDFDKAVNTFLKSVTVKDGKLLVEIGI